MARTSFKRTEEANVAVADESDGKPDTQLATQETAVVPHQPTPAFTGSWDRSDIKDPRINLVQKSSDSKLHKYGLGSLVLNREVKLSNGTDPVQITVAYVDKDYQQKLPWGSKDTANVVRTPEEVREAGGTLVYKGAKPGTFYGPRAHFTILLKAPAGLGEDELVLFPFEFNNEFWTPAKMTVSSSGFTSMAKEVATLCTYNKVMRKNPIFGQLALTSKHVAGDTEEWWVPVVKYVGENNKELLEFFESLR
jgi:hypothetical protein